MRPRDALCVPGLLVAGLFAASAWGADSDPAATPSKFELLDGDRVVMLGGTFIEREGQFGYIETALTAAYPDRNITFRNLGWSGDTVWAESRGIFDPPAAGYLRMIDLVKELKPTVILLAYGQNESFAGEAGLEAFVKQYEKLCDDLTPTNARLVFITPYDFERVAPPLPDASRNNANLALYGGQIKALADRRAGAVVELFGSLGADDHLQTENGIHLSTEGYAYLGRRFAQATGYALPDDAEKKLEALRTKIVAKNTLFFHRWRPQNVTYLFLFRKHEQGNNAVDIPEFDKLTAAADQAIAELRVKLNQ